MRIVRIKKNYCESVEEAQILYVQIDELPNALGDVDIRPIIWKGSIESIPENMLEKLDLPLRKKQ